MPKALISDIADKPKDNTLTGSVPGQDVASRMKNDVGYGASDFHQRSSSNEAAESRIHGHSRLHEKQRIFGFVDGLKTRNLVDFLSIDLPTTYKGLMEKTYTWIEAMEVATIGATSDYKEVLTSSTKSPRKILATKKEAKAFEQSPRMVRNRRSRNMFKYCHFHKDHRHETNQCREFKHQIEEAIKSRKLALLVKGINKGKEKASYTQLGE
ncbi:hypothetical protein Tco_1203055 [Tanacetum coccineum]